MILELTVENLAIIDRTQLALSPGFTVLTGETGAGKSLLIDAIELALGERADTELVRSGAPKATVSLVIDLSARRDLVELCRQLGVELEETTLYIHREVFAEGRSQCRIGGKLTPVSQLRQVGQYLVDLHGQHDHQSLLDATRHVGVLDAWIGEPAALLLEQVEAVYREAEELRSNLRALQAGMRDREHRLDLLRFQVDEIESVSPVAGEMEELEGQLSRLKNVERLVTAAAGAYEALRESDNLRAAVKGIEDVSRFDPALEPILETLRAAQVQLDDGAHDLGTYIETLEADPNLLELVAGRIDDLKRLRRKYGEDETAVLEFLDGARRELDLLGDAEASEEGLSAAVEAAESRLHAAAGELSQLRQARAAVFADLVERQLRDLAMERAVFRVNFGGRAPDARGCDDVEFFFSANAGEPPRPLGKIASGGEISRVMLAIKTAMAGRAGVPTLIFDEVDAGLGGKAAATVARKLEELAQHYQVLVISHLPQIAARATTHFRIEKGERDGRVTTEMRGLSAEERVEEIARMLVGERLTDTALANARELLLATPL